MAWYQPEIAQICFKDENGNWVPAMDVSFPEKVKLFIWNRLLWSGIRLRLMDTRFYQWILRA